MTNEHCTKHFDADGVSNSNVTGCIWCAIDAYEAEIKRLRALVPTDEPKCPCGTAYLRVEGGYVPVCACAAKNSVAVEPSDECPDTPLGRALSADNPQTQIVNEALQKLGKL